MEIELDTKPDKWLKAFINNKTLIWMRVMTHETFSLVIKPTTAWFILSIVFQFKWSLHQLDVKNAFLQCILREEVCDTTHWFCGFYSPISSFFDCTSLYGFKQATLIFYTWAFMPWVQILLLWSIITTLQFSYYSFTLMISFLQAMIHPTSIP